jgi:hypothetical protein
MHIEVYIELIMMHTGVKKKQLTHGGWLHYTTLVSLHIPASITFFWKEHAAYSKPQQLEHFTSQQC